MFSTQNVKISARSLAETTITNIVKECGNNNYTNSIVMKIMITNTSAHPMCKASTLIFCRFIWYPPPPHTKKLATPQMSPWQKKMWAPLGLCPPNPKLLPARTYNLQIWLVTRNIPAHKLIDSTPPQLTNSFHSISAVCTNVKWSPWWMMWHTTNHMM